jgi:hypothetical protein
VMNKKVRRNTVDAAAPTTDTLATQHHLFCVC